MGEAAVIWIMLLAMSIGAHAENLRAFCRGQQMNEIAVLHSNCVEKALKGVEACEKYLGSDSLTPGGGWWLYPACVRNRERIANKACPEDADGFGLEESPETRLHFKICMEGAKEEKSLDQSKGKGDGKFKGE